MRAYLDHNATSQIRPEAAEAISAALTHVGNPSSVHEEGRKAKGLIESARGEIAAIVGADAERVVFTSGGTEADNLAVRSAIAAGCQHLFISAIEHEAVREAALAWGADVVEIPVTSKGVIDFSWLKSRLSGWDIISPPFVAVMAANNETGVIQPYSLIADLVREAGGYLLVDAVQMPGKADFDFKASRAHFASLSAHKIGGPQGVGALLASEDAPLARQSIGGGQEKNHRSGTENVAGIAGFAAALKAASVQNDQKDEIRIMRDELQARLARQPGVTIWGNESERLNNTLCISAEGWPSEIQVIAMDLAGFAVSAGAACSSGKVRRSRVLEAMGATQLQAECALRISLGWSTSHEEVEAFANAWIRGYERARDQKEAS